MDHPQTVRVTLTYGDTLTQGVGGWSTVRVTRTPGITLTVMSVRVTLDSKLTADKTRHHWTCVEFYAYS